MIKWASSSPYEMMVEIAGLIFTGLLLATTYSIFEYPVWQVVIFGIIGALCALPFFILCNFSKNHKRIGTVLCLIVYLGGLIALFRLSLLGYYETGEGLMQWLVQDDENVSFSVYYTIVLAIGGAGLLGTAVYYFTIIRYRMGMLVAVSLLPCILYAKAIADVNNWYLVLLAGINLIECILQRRYRRELELKGGGTAAGIAAGMAAETAAETADGTADGTAAETYATKGTIAPFREKGGSRIDYLTRAAMILGFIAVVLMIAAAVPKESEARYYDLFEDTFLGGDISSEVMSVSGDLTDMSGNADGFRSVSNRRIYVVYGDDDISYLKRQTFDVYDFENDRWTALDDDTMSVYSEDEWDVQTYALNLSDLQSAFKYAEEVSPGFAAKYGFERIVSGDAVEYPQENLEVRSLNFSAEYYITPPGTLTVTTNDFSSARVTWAGNFVRSDGQHDENYTYDISYRGTRSNLLAWCMLGGADMSDDDCYDMFRELMDIYQEQINRLKDEGKNDEAYALANGSEYSAVVAYANQYAESIIYKDATENNTLMISAEVADLAKEVTEGCTYDWEKAQALQKYFRSGDFVYDIDYYAPDNSVEYFLFESKRGTCSDYATAFVLMARSLGMTVRYDEGYVAENQGQRGVYYIRESNAHAFPEVYIQGTGWIIFEPTSGIVDDSEKNWWGNLMDSIHMDYDLIRTIAVVAITVIVIVLIVRLLIPTVIETVFEIKLLSGRKKAEDAYKRLLKKASAAKLRKKYRRMTGRAGFTEEGVPSALAPARVREIFTEMNCDINVIIDEIEKNAYRGTNHSDVASPGQSKALNRMIVRAYRRGKKIFTI